MYWLAATKSGLTKDLVAVVYMKVVTAQSLQSTLSKAKRAGEDEKVLLETASLPYLMQICAGPTNFSVR
jgi:hypothetical protein